MEIRDAIQILGIPYKVLRVRSDDIPNDANCQIVFATQTIYLRNDLAPEYLEKSLWHEVLHGINPELSEEQTEWLANTFYCVLKQNDWLK